MVKVVSFVVDIAMVTPLVTQLMDCVQSDAAQATKVFSVQKVRNVYSLLLQLYVI